MGLFIAINIKKNIESKKKKMFSLYCISIMLLSMVYSNEIEIVLISLSNI